MRAADLFAVPAPQPRPPLLAKLRHDYPSLCFPRLSTAYLRHDRVISGICARCGTADPRPSSAAAPG